jgi:ABC-type glycerol-3-phosphate transport system permease component
LITVGIFSFLLSWADYVFALILIMSDDRKTLPVGLASMLGAQDLRWGEIPPAQPLLLCRCSLSLCSAIDISSQG